MNRSINSILRIAIVGLSLAGCGAFSPRPDPSGFSRCLRFQRWNKLR